MQVIEVGIAVAAKRSDPIPAARNFRELSERARLPLILWLGWRALHHQVLADVRAFGDCNRDRREGAGHRNRAFFVRTDGQSIDVERVHRLHAELILHRVISRGELESGKIEIALDSRIVRSEAIERLAGVVGVSGDWISGVTAEQKSGNARRGVLVRGQSGDWIDHARDNVYALHALPEIAVPCRETNAAFDARGVLEKESLAGEVADVGSRDRIQARERCLIVHARLQRIRRATICRKTERSHRVHHRIARVIVHRRRRRAGDDVVVDLRPVEAKHASQLAG